MNQISAVLFDLDGVITDTAEFHYQAWQRLADELGIPFDRAANEQFRGVSRADCLRLLLGGTPRDDVDDLLERKNSYYVGLLSRLTPQDILPGAAELMDELRQAGIKTAIGSVSKNTPAVLAGLGLDHAFDAVVDGTMVTHSKPDPEVFLTAARLLGVAPGLCLVVEDATAGVDAGLAGNMWTLGIGPAERVGHAHARLDSLDGATWDVITARLEEGAWAIRRLAPPTPDAHLETIFTTGNGHLGVRGTTLEPRTGESAASFMHAVWDDMPVSRTELANLPRWWGMDLWVNGVRLNATAPGQSMAAWSLDLKTGTLSRTLRWAADADTEVVVCDERCPSLDDPHLALVGLTLTVTRGTADVRLRSGVDVHVDNLGLRHWELTGQSAHTTGVRLQARTRATGIAVAVATAFSTEPAGHPSACDADGQPAVLTATLLAAGETLSARTVVALASTAEVDDPAATVAGCLTAAGGWDGLVAANATAWTAAWDAMDVAVDGDPAAQLAIRYALFQLVIAAPRLADSSVGAKTLSGFGYRHHIFWDTEIFMLPVFTYTQPDLARRMLAYRWHRLPGARRKASAGGYAGARFPWESAGTGDEVCPTWVEDAANPAELIRIWTGDLQLHLNADIAYAVMQFWRATGDDEFMRTQGAEVILDTATNWASVVKLEADGFYHIRDAMGPDEFHEHVDDNAFTLGLAAWHLRAAATVLTWLDATAPADATRLRTGLGLDQAAAAHWADVAGHLARPRIRGGVVEQHAGYFDLADVDVALARDPARTQSMQQIFGLAPVQRTQYIKQPDVLMLAYLLPDMFPDDAFMANYRFYDPRTDHELGSSLGPAISAVIACRAGDAAAAYAHFTRAAGADLSDARNNACDGIHGASAGGVWQAVVFGFAGLRADDRGWTTDPHLPGHWTRLRFRFTWRGERHEVTLPAA